MNPSGILTWILRCVWKNAVINITVIWKDSRLGKFFFIFFNLIALLYLYLLHSLSLSFFLFWTGPRNIFVFKIKEIVLKRRYDAINCICIWHFSWRRRLCCWEDMMQSIVFVGDCVVEKIWCNQLYLYLL